MAVPKATYSTITNLEVVPDKWDSYPKIDRSTVTSCKFISVDSKTKIERSTLNHVTINGEEGPSTIERSTIAESTVACSHIDRSELRNCPSIRKSSVERSTLSRCRLVDAHIERSTPVDCTISNQSSLERSDLKRCIIDDASMIQRSTLQDCRIARTKMERTTLTNCETYDCLISRCTFEGMVMKHGIWENNNLVGRTGQNEVVFKKPEAEIPKREPEDVPRGAEKSSHPPEMGDNLHIHIGQTPAPSKAALGTADEKTPLPEDDSYSRATGLTDEERSTDYSPQDTPVSDSPPPYEA